MCPKPNRVSSGRPLWPCTVHVLC
uniref:Uncharacterized protein n=1 Tax=Anguilla anguilla TaxID=7936 RepID=A0A0E9T413_ANGAN